MRRRVWIGGAATATVVALGLTAWGWWIAHPPAPPLPDQADAIVVFAGQPARYRAALELAREGRADTLVVSLGRSTGQPRPPVCEGDEPFTVLCPSPDQADTAGEAAMFADLAAEHGWRTLIAVTSDYHVRRSQIRLDRCLEALSEPDESTDGSADPPTATFHPIEDGLFPIGPVLHEMGGLVQAAFQRSC